jgi:acetylornithine deacetylase
MAEKMDAREMLERLVAFPTVSRESNLGLIEFVRGYLAGHGVESRIVPSPKGEPKANLYAQIGPNVPGGVVLSGHTDVVPVDGQDWATDPFVLTGRDGRLYGRGTSDMKGFIACVLAVIPGLAKQDLHTPVHLAFSYDEEVGCLGAQVMLKALATAGRRPGICIIGEPTEMRIIEGHKGCCEYTTRFTGLAGHGSAPDLGVSAVEYAVRYVARLMELREVLKTRTPAGSRFEPPWSTLQIRRVAGGGVKHDDGAQRERQQHNQHANGYIAVSEAKRKRDIHHGCLFCLTLLIPSFRRGIVYQRTPPLDRFGQER